MPKKILKKIAAFYRRKGETPKQAKKTAYIVANSKGLLKDRKKR